MMPYQYNKEHLRLTISCVGEGNGTPLQYSCLENPKDGGAWWAAVHGVAKSRTRLSSSSSISCVGFNALVHFKLSDKILQLKIHTQQQQPITLGEYIYKWKK